MDIQNIKKLGIDYSVSHKCLYGEHSICTGSFDVGQGTETCECPCHSNGGIHYSKLNRNYKRDMAIAILFVLWFFFGLVTGLLF